MRALINQEDFMLITKLLPKLLFLFFLPKVVTFALKVGVESHKNIPK
jgi:hypothetical protein